LYVAPVVALDLVEADVYPVMRIVFVASFVSADERAALIA
ncbi:adenosine deaminase, partial [Burkholderia pseudomallei]